MYSESDIEGAVVAGAITPDAAAALRRHIAATRDAPAADEESFRLLTGFNDIFVSIAIVLLLAALAQIGGKFSVALAGAAVSAASWLLAEYFTRRRRMALPSILLLLGFAGGVAAALIGVADMGEHPPERTQAIIGAGIGLVTAGATWLHWRRFMVPITVAAGATALVGTVVSLVMAIMPATKDAIYPIVLVAGIAVFALAMWWDMSDRTRITRRADVAFWLHLAAAPLIAHPVFQMLGVFDNDGGVGMAVIVLALYLLFGFIALAIDRRALLVSSLAYVLYAMYAIINSAGAVELSAAITGLIIGSALLILSAFWQRMRGLVIGTLGGISTRLPPIGGSVPASA